MKNTNKPKVIGYIPLMYGREYLAECIKSMEPFVERILIFYVDQPSQGHNTDIPCPETEQELRTLAEGTSDKVEWYKCKFSSEGEHRAEIYKYCTGFDLVLTLDADEVLDPTDVEKCLQEAYESDRRYFGITGFFNFWRSFDEVCLDGFLPVRVINLNNEIPYTAPLPLMIYHFSCAQSEVIVRYKWNVSGHKDELRPNWVDDTFYGEGKIDLHPVSIGLWNSVPFDKEALPDILKQHPNYFKSRI